jgi:O-acetyl-ADP-ribose deacetylase (regulator of RNase III)
MLSKQVPLGIYEKALPAGSAGWSGCSWQNSWVSILSKCQWMKRTSVSLASTGAANSVWRW